MPWQEPPLGAVRSLLPLGQAWGLTAQASLSELKQYCLDTGQRESTWDSVSGHQSRRAHCHELFYFGVPSKEVWGAPRLIQQVQRGTSTSGSGMDRCSFPGIVVIVVITVIIIVILICWVFARLLQTGGDGGGGRPCTWGGRQGMGHLCASLWVLFVNPTETMQSLTNWEITALPYCHEDDVTGR